jgi:hypothetical protein
VAHEQILARRRWNEDVDLAIKSEGGGEEVAVEEVLRAVAEDDAESGYHATQRVPDHPYLARQLSRVRLGRSARGLPKRL